MNKSPSLHILIVLLLIIVVFFLFKIVQNITTLRDVREGNRACTMEAKLCPDGSAVGRSGPNCEFAACPGE